jgi:hypothetical protein
MRERTSDRNIRRDGDEEHDCEQTLPVGQVHKTAQAPNEDECAVLWRWREGTHDDRLTRYNNKTNRQRMAKRENAYIGDSTPDRGSHDTDARTTHKPISDDLHDTIHCALTPSPAPMHK